MIVATDHMADAHIVIVDHHGQHIGGRAVRTQQDHVVEFAVLHGDAALHLVFYHRLALVGGLEPDDEGRLRTGFGRNPVDPASVISPRLPGAALGRPALPTHPWRG